MKTMLRSLLFAGAGMLLALAPSPLPVPQDPSPRAMVRTPTITPFLWFDDDAEQAIAFYTSLFPDSQLLSSTRWGEGGPVPAGTLMSATFRLAGRDYMALNGGPHYRLNEAFSLFVACKDQAEIDHWWQALLADGGQESRCGWLKDRFGVSWQIVPEELATLLADPDPVKAGRVGQALLRMQKIDLAALRRAHAGE